MINLICAMDRQGLIGKGGIIPWNRPDDMKNFVKMTTGHSVFMGRKTYDSIGYPLSGRENIVLSRQYDYNSNDGKKLCCGKPIPILEEFKKSDKQLFLIGGMEVYKQFASYVDKMYITIVDKFITLDGTESVFFPWPAFFNINWSCIEQKMLGPDYYFVFERINHATTKESSE